MKILAIHSLSCELSIKAKAFFKFTFWNFYWRHKLIAQ